MNVYDLEVSNGGPKMSVYPQPARTPVGLDNVRGSGEFRGSPTMSRLAAMLSGPAGRPVLDKTGLSERYNIILKFSAGLPPDGDAAEPTAPDLFTAVQQQLGLRLRPARSKLEVVVVDSIDEMPSEN